MAKKLGIPCFRLPLDSFYRNMNFGAQQTLNIDTSVMILSTYLDVKNWGKTLDLVLPPRYSRLRKENPNFKLG